jgi:hypothetical protein
VSRLLGRAEFAAGLAVAALCLCGWGCWRCGGEGESFLLRVHWVAVPEALRARRVNRSAGWLTIGSITRCGTSFCAGGPGVSIVHAVRFD